MIDYLRCGCVAVSLALLKHKSLVFAFSLSLMDYFSGWQQHQQQQQQQWLWELQKIIAIIHVDLPHLPSPLTRLRLPRHLKQAII